MSEDSDLPAAVVVDENGNYWRAFDGFYSMCPVSTDNDPVKVAAIFSRLAPTPPDNRVAPGQPNPVAPGSQPSATAPATALREALDREQRAWMVHGDRWEDEEVGSIIDRLRAALEADHD